MGSEARKFPSGGPCTARGKRKQCEREPEAVRTLIYWSSSSSNLWNRRLGLRHEPPTLQQSKKVQRRPRTKARTKYQVAGAASSDVFWIQEHDRVHKLHRNQLVPFPPRQKAPTVIRPDRRETPSGRRQENGGADKIAEVHSTNLSVADEAWY